MGTSSQSIEFLSVILLVIVTLLPALTSTSSSCYPSYYTIPNNSSAIFSTNHKTGRSGITFLDINGDGYQDIVVGSRNYDYLSNSTGAAFVYFGSSTGLPLPLDLDTLEGPSGLGFRLVSTTDQDQLGDFLFTPGDINNDGIDDLFVTSPGFDQPSTNVGGSTVIFGSSSFPYLISAPSVTPPLGFRVFGKTGYGKGFALTSGIEYPPIDWNNDGYNDIVFGNYAEQEDTGTNKNQGSVYIIFGNESLNFPPSLSCGQFHTQGRGVLFDGGSDFARFGNQLAAFPDMTGDNQPEFLAMMRVPIDSYIIKSNNLTGTNAFNMQTQLTPLDYQQMGQNSDPGVNYLDFGKHPACNSDINNDGYKDCLIFDTRGYFHLLFGHATMNPSLWPTDWFQLISLSNPNLYGFSLNLTDPSSLLVLPCIPSDTFFHRNVFSGFDFNGDGVDDVAITCPSQELAWIILGHSTSFPFPSSEYHLNSTTFEIMNLPSILINGSGFSSFGRVVAAGDATGDGFGDVLISTTGDSTNLPKDGFYVIQGRPHCPPGHFFTPNNLSCQPCQPPTVQGAYNPESSSSTTCQFQSLSCSANHHVSLSSTVLSCVECPIANGVGMYNPHDNNNNIYCTFELFPSAICGSGQYLKYYPDSGVNKNYATCEFCENLGPLVNPTPSLNTGCTNFTCSQYESLQFDPKTNYPFCSLSIKPLSSNTIDSVSIPSFLGFAALMAIFTIPSWRKIRNDKTQEDTEESAETTPTDDSTRSMAAAGVPMMTGVELELMGHTQSNTQDSPSETTEDKPLTHLDLLHEAQKEVITHQLSLDNVSSLLGLLVHSATTLETIEKDSESSKFGDTIEAAVSSTSHLNSGKLLSAVHSLSTMSTERFTTDDLLSVVSVLVEFFQLVSIVFFIRAPWSSGYSEFGELLAFTLLNFKTSWTSFYWFSFALIIIWAIGYVVIINKKIHDSFEPYIRNLPKAEIENYSKTKARFAVILQAVPLFLYFVGTLLALPITIKLFQAWHCQYWQFGSAEPTLVAIDSNPTDPQNAIVCFSSEHTQYLLTSILGFFLFVPISIYARPLWQEIRKSSLHVFFQPEFLVFKFLSKLFMACFAVFFDSSLIGADDTSASIFIVQLIIVFVISSALLIVNLKFKPCSINLINIARSCTLAGVVWTVVCGAIALAVNDPSNISSGLILLLGWAILLVVFLFAYQKSKTKVKQKEILTGRSRIGPRSF